MSGIARAVIIGNLTRDPEPIAEGKGARLGLAVNDRIKRGDEWTNYASFIDITVWGHSAKACLEYLHKGDPLAVDGRLRQERWQDKDGNNRSAVKVIADNVQFLGGRRSANESAEAPADEDAPF